MHTSHYYAPPAYYDRDRDRDQDHGRYAPRYAQGSYNYDAAPLARNPPYPAASAHAWSSQAASSHHYSHSAPSSHAYSDSRSAPVRRRSPSPPRGFERSFAPPQPYMQHSSRDNYADYSYNQGRDVRPAPPSAYHHHQPHYERQQQHYQQQQQQQHYQQQQLNEFYASTQQHQYAPQQHAQAPYHQPYAAPPTRQFSVPSPGTGLLPLPSASAPPQASLFAHSLLSASAPHVSTSSGKPARPWQPLEPVSTGVFIDRNEESSSARASAVFIFDPVRPGRARFLGEAEPDAGVAPPPPRRDTACFNCGNSGHAVAQCREPINRQRIAEARRRFQDSRDDEGPKRNMNQRYYVEESSTPLAVSIDRSGSSIPASPALRDSLVLPPIQAGLSTQQNSSHTTSSPPTHATSDTIPEEGELPDEQPSADTPSVPPVETPPPPKKRAKPIAILSPDRPKHSDASAGLSLSTLAPPPPSNESSLRWTALKDMIDEQRTALPMHSRRRSGT